MSEPEPPPLGKLVKGARGFHFIDFTDTIGTPCSLQESSVIGDYPDSMERPGTSAVWLGTDDPMPKVMAKDAAKVGLQTNETTGWVDFPIPDEVSLRTRMSLNREQVASLVAHLQHWLKTGSLK